LGQAQGRGSEQIVELLAPVEPWLAVDTTEDLTRDGD
jgi:hypothetical protein